MKANMTIVRILKVSIVILMISVKIDAQIFEVEGGMKVGDLQLENGCDSVVVILPDGTFAIRDVGSFVGAENQTLSLVRDTIYLSDGRICKATSRCHKR